MRDLLQAQLERADDPRTAGSSRRSAHRATSHPPNRPCISGCLSPGCRHGALANTHQELIPNSDPRQDWFYVCPGHLKDRTFCTPIIDQAAIDAKKKQEMEAEVEKVKKEYEERQRKKKEESEKSKDKDKDTDKEKDKDGDNEKADDKKADESKDDKVRICTVPSGPRSSRFFFMREANHVAPEG